MADLVDAVYLTAMCSLSIAERWKRAPNTIRNSRFPVHLRSKSWLRNKALLLSPISNR